MSPAANRYDGAYIPVPPVNIYNTKYHQLQGPDIKNHVKTVNRTNPVTRNMSTIVLPSVEYWWISDNNTWKVTLHSEMENAVIYPDIVNVQ